MERKGGWAFAGDQLVEKEKQLVSKRRKQSYQITWGRKEKVWAKKSRYRLKIVSQRGTDCEASVGKKTFGRLYSGRRME